MRRDGCVGLSARCRRRRFSLWCSALKGRGSAWYFHFSFFIFSPSFTAERFFFVLHSGRVAQSKTVRASTDTNHFKMIHFIGFLPRKVNVFQSSGLTDRQISSSHERVTIVSHIAPHDLVDKAEKRASNVVSLRGKAGSTADCISGSADELAIIASFKHQVSVGRNLNCPAEWYYIFLMITSILQR